MKQLISACMLCLPVWAGAVMAQEPSQKPPLSEDAPGQVDDRLTTPDWVDFSILPNDIESLRELNSRHRSIAREASRTCFGARGGVPSGSLFNNPCVLRRVATGLNVEGDSRLNAFHYALPLRVRYNGMRTEVDWRQPVEQVIAGGKPQK